MRGQATIAWDVLEARVAGKDREYAGLRIVPLIGTVRRRSRQNMPARDAELADVIDRLFDELSDRSMQLPGEV